MAVVKTQDLHITLDRDDMDNILPGIINRVKESFEQNVFLAYPKGLILHLYGHELNEAASEEEKKEIYDLLYKRVYKTWSRPDFPRLEEGNLKGVYLNELNKFLRG